MVKKITFILTAILKRKDFQLAFRKDKNLNKIIPAFLIAKCTDFQK